MNFLFSVGPFEFNWASLITFGVGLFFGVMIVFLLYIIAILKNLNKNIRIRKTQEDDIDEAEILWLIDDSVNLFRDRKTREEAGYLNHIMTISKELSKDVACKFFPESSAPHLELTVDEVIHLGHYVIDRVSELLDTKLLRLFKGMTIKRIMQMKDIMDKADEKLIEPSEKHGFQKVAKALLSAINIINPVYWIRKVTMNKVLDILLIKVGSTVITIVGEETYKIYSKKVFAEERNIEEEVSDLYTELERELKSEAMNDEKEEKQSN